jgi:ABC-type multidrug transport system ATPase subunit
VRVDAVRGRALGKRYGATSALRAVDVDLEPGHLTRIEGANGSGKSTLLGTLGWSVAPTSGTVEYIASGRTLEPSEARCTLGWVSHETLAYGDLSGRANVELAARLHGLEIGSAWSSAADRFELGTFAERPLRTNSRGQRQRIALARALVHRPSVVLLDEPTTGLDASGVERLLAVVEEELVAGAIVAVVTHEPEVFVRLGGSVITLERGRRVD